MKFNFIINYLLIWFSKLKKEYFPMLLLLNKLYIVISILKNRFVLFDNGLENWTITTTNIKQQYQQNILCYFNN